MTLVEIVIEFNGLQGSLTDTIQQLNMFAHLYVIAHDESALNMINDNSAIAQIIHNCTNNPQLSI